MMTMMVMTTVMTMIMTKKTMKMMLLPMILVMMAMAISRFAFKLKSIIQYFPVVALALPMQEEMKKRFYETDIF